MMIHVESANNFKPTMTAIAAMGDNPKPFQYMEATQLASRHTKEKKDRTKTTETTQNHKTLPAICTNMYEKP